MSEYHRSSAWAKFKKRVRPIIQASLPQPCVNAHAVPGCTGVVHPGQAWDVAHRVSHHLDPFAPLTIEAVGPAHQACNRTAGGREGRAKQLGQQRRTRSQRDERLPGPESGWVL